MNNEEKILEILEKHGELLKKLDDRSQRTAVLLETEYKHKLDTLYEGHQAIMDALTPKERIEELEADVSVLKIAVRTLSEELQVLKKAR